MAEHVEVFISATTRDLGSFRRDIKDALLTLQIFPIEESNFTLAYGPLTVMLSDLIGRCDAVIHLVGSYYGAEPPQRPPGEPRRSYTQREYDMARKLGKPIYLFLAAEDCAFDERPAQGEEEEEALQRAHRHAIEQCGDIYYPFATREDLRSRVRELRFPARGAEAPRRVANLLYASLGPLFKGRDAALADLRKRLRGGPCQTIHGLGGVGKTRLAIEYAWRHAGDYTALLFASAPSAVDLRTHLVGFCDPLVLDLPEQSRPEETARLAAVFRWLDQNPGWLLILDNADTQEAAAEVEKTLPQLQGGQVLITSRLADWSPAVQTAAEPLAVLDETEAAAFLLERTELRRKKMLTDQEDAAAIARNLGGLALALEQAGAYVWIKRISFLEYSRRWEDVLDWHDERLMKYPKSVAKTWETTIKELSQSERKLLSILAWFAPEPIPLSLLEGNIVDGADARDTLAGLASWSLARWMADGEGFTVHRLVQEITRQRLTDNERHDTLESAIALLDRALPSPDWDQKGWQLWVGLSPHLDSVAEASEVLQIEGEPLARIYRDYGGWHYLQARFNLAEPLMRRALRIDEKNYGPDHPNVARDLNNLAQLLQATGRFGKAEPLMRRALEIDEKHYGPQHPDVARDLNTLAQLLQATGRFGEAEPLMRRALEIDEKHFGPQHPDVATDISILGALLQDTNRLEEAEPLYRRALEIDEKSYGPEHLKVARDLNNLAALLQDLAALLQDTNRLGEAEPLYRRALAIDEKIFGPEHPRVAIRLNNLAGLLRDTSRLEEVESLLRRALGIDEKYYEPEHPTIATRLNNLAQLLKTTNRLEEAEPLVRRALEIDEKCYGPEHPRVAADLNELAELYRAQGQYAKAEPLYGRALSIWEKALGPDHPNLARGLNNLAELFRATNRLAEAETLYRRALAIYEKALGPEHPIVARGLDNLAGLLSDTNRLAEAEPLSRRHLRIFAKFGHRTGHEHPHFRSAIDNYAGLLAAMGLSQDAIAARVRSAIEGEPEESA